MKKICFTLLCLGYFFSVQARVDTMGLDSTCVAYIIPDFWTGDNTLTAYAYDILEPTATFSFSWSTGDTSATIPVTGPGDYCVTATSHSTNCTAERCFTVEDECGVEVAPLPGLGLLVAYGTSYGPYSYAWSTGDTTETIQAIDGETYCVTVTDVLGCSADTCVVYDGGLLDSFCHNYIWYSVDSVTLEVTLTAEHLRGIVGLPGDASYVWSTGETTQSITITNPSGEYCVTSTDSSGCEASSCIDFDDLFCEAFIHYDYDETFTAHAYGYAPYSYVWSSGETTQSITVTAGEEYCVTVTDALGCEISTCLVADTIRWPLDTFCFNYISYDVDSNTQEITLTAEHLSGIVGIPSAATYSWSNGDTTQSIVVSNPTGEYCVTTTDSSGCVANSCIDFDDLFCEAYIAYDYDETFTAYAYGYAPYTYAWSTGDTSQSITVTMGEEYCVTVTDALGCEASACLVADTIRWPLDSLCYAVIEPSFNGTELEAIAQLFPSSGDVTYAWSTGDTTQVINASIGETYCVTITDLQTQCAAETCLTFEDPGCEIYHILCDPDGTLGVIFSGIAPYSYQWSTGDTTETIIGEIDSTYCVTVTDALGCTADTCFTFTGMPPRDSLSQIIGFIDFADSTVDGIAEGYTYLYHTPDGGVTYDLVDSFYVITNGFFGGYAFSVQPGTYITKAVLTDIMSGENYIPAYHYEALQWQDADPIEVGEIPVFANIRLSGITSLTGDGTVSGVIIDPEDYTGSSSRNDEMISNVTMTLTDGEGNPLQYVITDASGEFSFADLPHGAYRLYADYLNVRSNYVSFVIDENNRQHTFNFEMENGEIMLYATNVVLDEKISIYPNPVIGQPLYVKISDNISVKSIKLMEATGKLTVIQENNSTDEIIIDTQRLSPGMYVLQIVTDIGIRSEKVMILD